MAAPPSLSAHTARPQRTLIGPGPPPEEVIAGLSDDDHPLVLWGRWFGGDVMIMTDPIWQRGGLDAAEVWSLLDDQPSTGSGSVVGGSGSVVGGSGSVVGGSGSVVGGSGSVRIVGGGWAFVTGYSPGMSWVGCYDHLLRHRADEGWSFESLGLSGQSSMITERLAAWRERLRRPTKAPDVHCTTDFRGTTDGVSVEAGHLAAVETAIGRIDRGDFYQVNLCTRLRATLDGDGPGLFARAARKLDPDYGAMITTGPRRQLVSFSPELFLATEHGTVRTAPIKGTSARADDPDGTRLARSAKDAAENVMITDLMRNDLSQVCSPGTVAVPDLLRVEPHAGVWQLVSTVTGRLRPGVGPAELLRASFPPGSVSGAPKSAAVRAIAELEPDPRGAYTGCLGLASPTQGLTASVIIRTFELDHDHVELGVGGGITVDSVPVHEWREGLHKARPLLAAVGARLDPGLDRPAPPVPPELLTAGLLETVLVRGGRVQRWPAHLARLDRSCRELYDQPAPPELTEQLSEAVAEFPTGRAAVRVTVRPGRGRLRADVSGRPWSPSRTEVALSLADRPEITWRHKWADRRSLTEAEHATAPALPYFVSPDGWVSETSRGNLFLVDHDGVWHTPPADDHLLPGVTRRDLLDLLGDLGIPVRLRRFGAGELHEAAAAVWTSSLSGVIGIDRVDDQPLGALPRLAELRFRLGFTDRL